MLVVQLDCCATVRVARVSLSEVVVVGDLGCGQSPGNFVLFPTVHFPPPTNPVFVLLGMGLCTPVALRRILATAADHRLLAGFLCIWRIAAHAAAREAALVHLALIHVVL